MKIHVLDANALHRFLVRGPGFEIVRQVFHDATLSESKLLMSVINWGEVYYTMVRQIGFRAANAILAQLHELPLRIVDADKDQTRGAAELKCSYGLPYADCFAAALAGRRGVLVTADVKDFSRIPWLQTKALPRHRN